MSTAYRRYIWHDAMTGGSATISGTVRELTTPVANRRVVLFTQEHLLPRRETRSASNGTYSFSNIATGVEWLVLAFDPNGAYNAVVADRVQT